MNKGILYVAFGKDYTIPLKTSIEFLRRVSDLPVCVLTNQKTLPIKVEHLVYLDMDTNQNRIIRTTAIKYTPFDQTLMMDSDSVPISAKISSLFDGLSTNDFGFQKVKEFTTSVPKNYGHALYKTKLTTPLTAYSGGVLLFNNTPICHKLFNQWHEYWQLTGSGRDMPALACAIKTMQNQIKFYLVENCIDRNIDYDTILFHAYGDHDKTLIPEFTKNKWFDIRNDIHIPLPVKENVRIAYDPFAPFKHINYIDIGAYTGDTVQPFLSQLPLFTSNFSVYAFEPFQPFVDKLKKIKHSALTIIEKGVSYDGKDKSFFLTKTDPLISQGHSINPTKNNIDLNNKIMIPTVKFSTWFKKNIKPKSINIVKINIEGAETEFLRDIYESGIYKNIHHILFSGWTTKGYPADFDKIDMTQEEKDAMLNILRNMYHIHYHELTKDINEVNEIIVRSLKDISDNPDIISIKQSIDFKQIQEIETDLHNSSNPLDKELLKYCDIDVMLKTHHYWATTYFNLHTKRKLKILDLGSGCGWFPLICQYFKHDVILSDLPNKDHFLFTFNRFLNILKLTKTYPLSIESQITPKLSEKFDAISAMGIVFSHYWTMKDWQWFFDWAIDHLNSGVETYIFLTPNVSPGLTNFQAGYKELINPAIKKIEFKHARVIEVTIQKA